MPMSLPRDDDDAPSTRLESVQDIRAAIAAREGKLGKAAGPTPNEATPFRPLLRPPTARLCVVFDGQTDGDWHTLMAERCVIGRTEGQITIPHDDLISSRHAEIVREKTAAGWRWVLIDLGSTNGVYVRASSSALEPGREFLLGSTPFRFDPPAPPEPRPAQELSTRKFARQTPTQMIPSIVRLDTAGATYPLTNPPLKIGRDAACHIVVPDDPCLSPVHAVIVRETDGKWKIENQQSANGLWVKLPRIALGKACQFQLGEQRFFFRPEG